VRGSVTVETWLKTFSRTDASGARFLLSDALGSTVALVDSAGVIQTSYTYEPFGKTTIAGSANGNAQQFTGRENDGPLYFYRARYYHPEFGRFASEDPTGFAGSATNLYAYAGDDPVDLTDPSGQIVPAIVGIMVVSCGFGATLGAVGTIISMFTLRMPWDTRKPTTWGDVARNAVTGCVTNAVFAGAATVVSAAWSAVANRAGAAASDLPPIIYRQGGSNPGNFVPRPIDEGALSFRDSLSNPIDAAAKPVMNPGKPWVAVDTTKLPPGSVIPDGVPPGHVTVIGATPQELQDAVIDTGKFPR
jgi:RHS repeat-associated protein